ncbi:protein HESO1-like isoform X3 [Panicum virgatum]|uniref:protein HESO1-like isoform X3 n=1 Tax=Panicum virgatum TaxID=38727 RepID=UPI0019D50589|nr:protein HESO1-like isoform X3 [Panicum virgatum]
MEFIPNARVPIIQYMSNQYDISCDISINNYPGRMKSRIFYWINTIDERFGDMVLLVKEWAKTQNINDPKNETLNSYSLCLLVIFYFQRCEPAILPPLKEIYDGDVAKETVFYDEKYVDEVCAANIARFLHQNMGQRNQTCLSLLFTSFFHQASVAFQVRLYPLIRAGLSESRTTQGGWPNHTACLLKIRLRDLIMPLEQLMRRRWNVLSALSII